MDSLNVLLQLLMLVDRSSCADEIQNGVEALRESADSDHRHHVASEHVPFSCRDTCVEGPGCTAWRQTTECASPLPANVISHSSHPLWLSSSATITFPSGSSPRQAGLSKRAPHPCPRSRARIARNAWFQEPDTSSPPSCRQHQSCGNSCRTSPRTREQRAGEAARTCSGCVLLWSQPSLRRRCLLVGALFFCVYTQPSSAASNLNSF